MVYTHTVYTDVVYQHCILSTYPSSVEKKSQAYYLGGIQTHNLCNSSAVSYKLKFEFVGHHPLLNVFRTSRNWIMHILYLTGSLGQWSKWKWKCDLLFLTPETLTFDCCHRSTSPKPSCYYSNTYAAEKTREKTY